MAHATADSLVEDLMAVVRDAEELLKATAGLAGEKVDVARERAEASIRSARERISTTHDEVIAQTREAAHQADAYVRRNPWQAVGIAALAGLMIGLVAGRR